MKIKKDQVTGLVLVVLGIILFVLMAQFKKPFTAAYPGPKALPGIGAFGLVVCGAGIFLEGCKKDAKNVAFVDKAGWIRIIASFAILCIYILAMKYLGFILVTPFVLFGLTSYFAKASKVEAKLWVRIVFAIAVTAVIYLMYVPLFGMTLPSGLLFD